MNNLVVDLDDPTVKLWGRLAVYALVFLAPGYANSSRDERFSNQYYYHPFLRFSLTLSLSDSLTLSLSYAGYCCSRYRRFDWVGTYNFNSSHEKL